MRNSLEELRERLGLLLADEDLVDEKLREASEGLLPQLYDALAAYWPRLSEEQPDPHHVHELRELIFRVRAGSGREGISVDAACTLDDLLNAALLSSGAAQPQLVYPCEGTARYDLQPCALAKGHDGTHSHIGPFRNSREPIPAQPSETKEGGE